MRVLIPCLVLLLLAACDDDTNGVADTAPPQDAAVLDSVTDTAVDGAVPDGAAPEATLPDGPAADSAAPDAAPADDTMPADAAPADTAPSALQVTVDKVTVWANLMPVVPPDPTHVDLTLSLSNSGSTQMTGIKLVDASIAPVGGAAPQAIQLQAAAGFSGTVPAGQTVQAKFSKILGTTSTPLPAQCNASVEVGFSVAFDGGKVGPLTTGPTVFGCAY